MKIAFVLTQSLDSPSGLGRYWPLARALARLGHRVDVIALHYDWHSLSPKAFTKDGVRVIYAGQMHVRKVGPRKLYFGPGRLLWISLASTWRLARALAQTDAELIHVCKPQPYNVLAARLGRRGRPLFYDCDDYEAETNRFSAAWQQRVVRYFEDGIVRDAAGLTVNTHFTERRYRALGVPAGRIVYVPNGVDRARFARQPDPAPLRRQWDLPSGVPVVVYVGTMGLLSHPVDLLLEAFRTVVRRVPAARLLLVGGGEDYDTLQQQAERLGIAVQTTFTGRVPPETVPDYLALGTVSVDPVHDNLVARARSPLKVLESLAMGVPVVTSDVGDRRALLDGGELGVLVPAGDGQALAAGLLALLQDPQRRAHIADAARAQRERWYWDTLVHDFVQVYDV